MRNVMLSSLWAATAAAVSCASGCPSINLTTLQAALSADAEIFTAGTAEFNTTSARWSALDAPVSQIVVVPATAADVQATVKYASSNNIKFLATNGAHGAITTLGKLNCGIEIYMTKLDSIAVSDDGTTMTVGGGVIAGNLTRTLYESGKQAVTGTCECVSYLGPALGGGHGWLQGYHGLIADQFVSLDVVLANGSLVTVSEDGPDPELFWALKGAGHNFGIVTSATSKIYDIAADKYALSTIFIPGANVKAAYEIANTLWLGNNGADNTVDQPVDLAIWSYWFYDPTIDATGPVVVFYIIQAGVDTVDSQWTTPFDAVDPIMTVPDVGTYLDLAAWTGIDFASTPCAKTGNANNRFPVYLPAYNGTAMEEAYALFKYATAPTVDAATNVSTAAPFPNSLFMAEGYPQQGVKAVDDASAAFAFRDDNLLIAPLLIYPLDAEGVNEALAYKLGTEIREALRAGSPGSNGSYVNYSYGDETTANWYGADAWRQERLRSLKTEYDPQGRFSFYGPIASPVCDDEGVAATSEQKNENEKDEL